MSRTTDAGEGRLARWAEQLRSLCRKPKLPLWAALLAVLLCSPALVGGYAADDWFHQAVVRQVEPVGQQRSAVVDLFSFFDGDQERNGALRDAGILPWWASLELKARFFRPLSGATHALDDVIAHDSPFVAHAHSLLWLFGWVCAAGWLFREVHGAGAVAGLAVLLFALDEGHGVPAGWIANRNGVVAGLFGALSIAAYVRSRRGGGWPWYGAALGFFALALAGAEAGIAVTAFVFAFAVCLDERPGWLAKLAPLTGFAALVVGWRALYSGMGFGTAGSGLYLDPLSSPGAFLVALPERALALVGEQLLSAPSAAFSFLPAGPKVVGLVLVGGAVLGLGAALWRWLGDSREARFWALGAALALLPVCATFPMGRNLGFVGLGGAGLVALLVQRVLWAPPAQRSPGATAGGGAQAQPLTGAWPRRAAWGLLALHLPLAALQQPAQAYAMHALGGVMVDPCEAHAPRGPDAAEKTVVFVNANDLCTAYVGYKRAVFNEPAPTVRLLASAIYDIEVTGVDAHTLELSIPAGMQSQPADALLRTADDPLPVGARVALPGADFEVLGHNEAGLVDRVRVRFEARLTSRELVWVRTFEGAPAPFIPPSPGETVALPGAW